MNTETKSPACGMLAGEPAILGSRCKDGGTCHHRCESRCVRESSCLPLSASIAVSDAEAAR